MVGRSLACGVCGAPAPAPYRPPAAEMAPDLDFRPGEPARSTLPRWTLACPACGAAAADLSALTPADRAAMAADGYAAPPVRAGQHHWRAALIRAARPGGSGAFTAFLWAAWAADDAGHGPDAVLARVWALGALGAEGAAPPRVCDQAALTRLDATRRAGHFEAAAALAARLAALAPDPSGAAIVAFQAARAAAADAGRYTLASALRPPARTPHASHGARRQGGFWDRLRGR